MIPVTKLPASRVYDRRECITFRKTAECFGGLSNMAGGYNLNVNGIKILTSEALYQACRFPHLPDVQRLIIAERSPMTAKMVGKPYRNNSRVDWDINRLKIMRWCLQVKLIQNWDKFSNLLRETGNLPIVEDSKKDDYWGAKPQGDNLLIGANVLGRLLMQLREQIKNQEITPNSIVDPLEIQNFLLYEKNIGSISGNGENHWNNFLNSPISNEINNQFDLDMTYTDIPLPEFNLTENNHAPERLNNYIEPNTDRFDSFKILLPFIIESLLETERTDKELAELFKVPLKQMRHWLVQATTLGQISKLSRPIRYAVDTQLTLIG